MGLEAISGHVHRCDAVALEDSEVCVIPYEALRQLTWRVPALQTHLLRLISREITRDQGLLLLLGGLTAEQRIGAFLLSLSNRYQRLGYAGTRFSVRMGREEIGSYLGLSMETVSRILSRLQRDGVIRLKNRQVELIDLMHLRSLASLYRLRQVPYPNFRRAELPEGFLRPAHHALFTSDELVARRFAAVRSSRSA